jgi:hypothetical protein
MRIVHFPVFSSMFFPCGPGFLVDDIPCETEIDVSKESLFLSVMCSGENGTHYSGAKLIALTAYALADPEVTVTVKKKVYLLRDGTDVAPKIAVGWRFLNSFIIDDPFDVMRYAFHAFVQVC